MEQLFAFLDYVFWQNFASNGLATLLGAIIGIPIALWISRYQEQKIERERKEKILILLLEELRFDYTILNDWKQNKNKDDFGEYLCSQIRIESWKAFSDGGELEWIKDPALLNILAQSYYSLRKVSFLSEIWLKNIAAPPRSYSHPSMHILTVNLNKSIDEAIDILVETVDEVHKQAPRA